MIPLYSPRCPFKLKKLLKTHTPAALPESSPPKSKGLLPDHLLSEIGRYSHPREILHLSLCARRLQTLFAPLLYARVELKTNRHCKTTLIALLNQPHLAHHVRKLVIRVNNPEWTDPGYEINEDIIASFVEDMATTGCLKGLRSFEWDGLEMPHDDLWLSLKVSCLELKRIRSTVGEEPLCPSSPLWEFRDLRVFGLTVKCHSLHWLADGLPKPERLPKQLWVMLLERSPRLEELILGGPAPSPRIFDIRHVTSGRWPRLRSICLGDMMLISAEKGGEVEANSAFTAFFAFHGELRHVGLDHAGGSAFYPGAFDFGGQSGTPRSPEVLPKLESFSGSWKYVKTLPSKTRRQLKSLRLTCLHHTVGAVGPTVNALYDLNSLEDLSVWVDLSFSSNSLGGSTRRPSLDGIGIGTGRNGEQSVMNDDEKVLSTILGACPDGLKHLDVACFTRPGLSIKEFSSVLALAPPSLTSFNLTKVHKSGDEDLSRCAARIVTDNPGLKQFTLRVTHGSWFSAGGSCGRIRAMGSYEIVSDLGDLSSAESLIGEHDSWFTTSPATSSPPSSPLSPVQETAFTNDSHASGAGPVKDSRVVAAQAGLDSPVDTPQLSNSFSSSRLPSPPMPTSLIAHEWGQKSLSLTSKEFARHFVYRLTEKEVETCRVQIRNMRRRWSEISTMANNVPNSSVSRSSSGSSTASWQRYGNSYERRQLTSASFSNFGSLRRKKGHQHSSSSMSSVMRTSGGLQHPYCSIHGSLGYRNHSITWADQFGMSINPGCDDLVRRAVIDRIDPEEGYILV